jgi:hypothetical protein
VSVRPLLSGLATYFPRFYEYTMRSTGGTSSARYCYSVWLRHLTMAHKNNLPIRLDTVAELGPGDSLGIGLSALISGANRYFALDVLDYDNRQRDGRIFDELIDLFMRRERIPDEDEFPLVKPYLSSYEFPAHILTNNRLDNALQRERLDTIRAALLNPGNQPQGNIQILYFAPWYNSEVIKAESVDMILSQAVLEYPDDLLRTYKAMYHWLKSGGFISHQIDFKSHGTSQEWNGHWTYSDFVWGLMRGKRPYFLNREPHSTHINVPKTVGFEVVCDIKIREALGISRKRLASRYRHLSDEDLTTSGAFIQAVKL